MNGACRSLMDGLPYWPRLKLYMNASYVSFEKVHDTAMPFRHPVGSPSLIAGYHADRIGCVTKGVRPRMAAPMQTITNFHRKKVFGRRKATAISAAGPGRPPAMWLA